uniref:Uncharacterized protein n=1 Tax=Panagrolaimus superbus TaxID=310955 RepID=A0A914XZ36_9BILA
MEASEKPTDVLIKKDDPDIDGDFKNLNINIHFRGADTVPQNSIIPFHRNPSSSSDPEYHKADRKESGVHISPVLPILPEHSGQTPVKSPRKIDPNNDIDIDRLNKIRNYDQAVDATSSDAEFKLIIEVDNSVREPVVDEYLKAKQRQERINLLEKELQPLRGTQFGGGRGRGRAAVVNKGSRSGAVGVDANSGGGGGDLTSHKMYHDIAIIYYKNYELFSQGGSRFPNILQRKEEVWQEINNMLQKNNYTFNVNTIRKNFSNFISKCKEKLRKEDVTGAEPVTFTEAEEYILDFEKKEESLRGIRTSDLGAGESK